MYRIVIADDHQIVRDGLKLILGTTTDFEIVGEASNGVDLVKVTNENVPDLILSDLKMPGPSIIESCAKLKELHPSIKIVVLTAFDENEDIYEALNVGIDGYLMKDTDPSEILTTLKMVMMGYSLFQPKVNLNNHNQQEEQVAFNLTERESEVFELIIDNLSNSEIADKLFISEATVKTHVSSILRKTGQTNRSQAVLFALKNGYVTVKTN